MKKYRLPRKIKKKYKSDGTWVLFVFLKRARKIYAKNPPKRSLMELLAPGAHPATDKYNIK